MKAGYTNQKQQRIYKMPCLVRKQISLLKVILIPEWRN
jgi:hypothetical protein